MKHNIDKCKFLLFGNVTQQQFLKVHGENIWESKSAQLLEVEIEKSLKFDNHVRNICTKVNRKLTVIGKISRFMDFDKRRLLFKSFVESQFSYCSLIWMFHGRCTNQKINLLHERALRLVYPKLTHLRSEELLVIDGSFTVHHKNIQNMCIDIYKELNSLSPDIVKGVYDINNQNRYNTRNSNNLRRVRNNTVYHGEFSLKSFGPVIWDLVPKEIKYANSVVSFKELIRQWKPDSCPCRLCKRYIDNLGFID